MRRSDLAIMVLVLSLGGFVAYQALRVKRVTPPPVADVSPAVAPSTGDVTVTQSAEAPATRDVDAIRRRLLDGERGTYVGEILAARDSNLARWPDRLGKPVTVWIDEQSPLARADLMRASNARRAFDGWNEAHVPIAYTFIADSASAEVRVTFVERFEGGRSGRTRWKRDTNWWIHGGDIELSLHSESGRPLKNEELYAIALHEVGHLLGLDHTANPAAIMAARVSVLTLAPEDIATMRLLYELPPGSVRR